MSLFKCNKYSTKIKSMDINELENFRLEDAVKFHDRLNPKIWGSDDHLLPKVRENLMAIADDFREFLGVSDLKIKDITISGSNAAYTYTPHSDIDLHLVVEFPKDNEVYRELFDAKKYQYNDQHNFKIGGADVELYVQDADQTHVSQGIYSVRDNKWLSVPKRRKPDINDISVKSKYEDIGRRVDDAIASGSLEQMDALSRKIREMRQSGLEKTGEFGPENLAFKVLRNNGTLQKLRDARNAAKDQLMSITERKKKKKKAKKKFKYGSFGGYYFPGYHYYGSTDAASDGGGGGESVREQLDVKTFTPARLAKKHGVPLTQIMQQLIKGIRVELEHTTDKKLAKEIALDHLAELPDYYDRLQRAETNESTDSSGMIDQFVDFCADHLGLAQRPQVKIKRDPAWSERNATFGRYMPDDNVLIVSVANRHPLDIMRTLAHELTHHRQQEQQDIPMGAGETGSEFENEANAEAGVIMRKFAELHPEYFGKKLNEASGYIPVNDREAQDPRYSMALTQDIRPGEPRRQAAKMGWSVTDAGVPPLLMKKLENQLQVIKESRELDEVSMSPGSLKAFADSPEAAGMLAGFEAELIFSGLGESGEGELEPDYNEDRVADSIEDVIDFFESGPYSDMSFRQIQRLRSGLEEQFLEWQSEQIGAAWDNEGRAYLSDYIRDEDEFDEDSAREEAEESVRAQLGDDVDIDAAVDGMVQEKFEDFVDEVWNKAYDSRIYERAYEQYYEEIVGDFSEGDWFDDNRREMSDIAYEYDLSWPYMNDIGGEGGFNEENAERLADDLAETLGVKTQASGGYHSAKRDATTWIFEPDSSLEPDDADDMPVEIVSPPMPLTQALEVLPKFFEWAVQNGAYSNESTGFHMSVSMPEHAGDKLDYVKLALFLGDEYVLKQFGRAANTYTASALGKIRKQASTALAEDATRADTVLKSMRDHLDQLAVQALAKPSGFGKYTSINPKDNYIEFRSAGGSDYFGDIKKIQNTLMRYARATSIAMNPAAEKQEYAKKLYKLLSPAETQTVVDPRTGRKRTEIKPRADQDAIAIFSRYVAGELPKSALKSFIKQLQYGREVEKTKADQPAQQTTQPLWYVSQIGRPGTEIQVRAESPAAAYRLAQERRPDIYPAGTDADNIRVAREPVARPINTTAAADAADRADAEFRQRQQFSQGGWTGQWIIKDANGRELHKFGGIGNSQADANRFAARWLAQNGYTSGIEVEVVPEMR